LELQEVKTDVIFQTPDSRIWVRFLILDCRLYIVDWWSLEIGFVLQNRFFDRINRIYRIKKATTDFADCTD
jgi:hypothetical protein